jgi:hypothetical protein
MPRIRIDRCAESSSARSTLEPGVSLSLEEQATLFEVTHVFERMTYFLRGIAQELAAGAGSRFDWRGRRVATGRPLHRRR